MLNIFRKIFRRLKSEGTVDNQVYDDGIDEVAEGYKALTCYCARCIEEAGDVLGFVIYYDYDYVQKFYGDSFLLDLTLNDHFGEKFYSAEPYDTGIYLVEKIYTEPYFEDETTDFAIAYAKDKKEWFENYTVFLHEWLNKFSEKIIPKEELDSLIKSNLEYAEDSDKNDIFLDFKKLVTEINSKDDLEKMIIYICIRNNYVPFKEYMLYSYDFSVVNYSNLSRKLQYAIKAKVHGSYDIFYDTTNDIYDLTNFILSPKYDDYFIDTFKDLKDYKIENFKFPLKDFNYIMTSDDVLRVLPIVKDFNFYLQKLQLDKSYANSSNFNKILGCENFTEFLIENSK